MNLILRRLVSRLLASEDGIILGSFILTQYRHGCAL